MAEFISLYSGSSGNSSVVRCGAQYLIVDMGKGVRTTTAALKSLGLAVSDCAGILVTHEHSDHVKGLAQFAMRTGVPIYGSRETLMAVCTKLGSVMPDRFTAFSGRGPFEIGALSVTPFAVPHDVPCLGYRVEGESGCFAMATDIGYAADSIRRGLQGADFVLVEANHDLEMLMGGPYPVYLKRRIASDEGHLSNEDCGGLCLDLVQTGCEHFLLGHLSSNNNLPSLAVQAVCGTLMQAGIRPGEVTVDVAPRLERSPLFEFGRTQTLRQGAF